MRHYLDHAATTPLRPEARDAWLHASETVGNASSTHAAGQDARRLLEESRERAAAVLDAEPIEIVFTSGARSRSTSRCRACGTRANGTSAIVLPDAEHHATMDTAAGLVDDGAELRRVPVTEQARIDPAQFEGQLAGAALATALVANNEAGTINEAASLARAAAGADVPLHLDAVAALGHLPLSFRALRGEAGPGVGLVAMSLAGHKIGAPVGVGALVTARTARLTALLRGGAQQRGLRAGTQDVPGAAAFATALELAEVEREEEGRRLRTLRDRLVSGIRTAVPDVVLLGDQTDRLPGNAHLLFPGAVGESLLFLLDVAGVAASTGSACQAGVAEPSHVVMAMGRSERDARSVLRFSLGRTSTDADVDAVLAVIADTYARASGAGTGARS
ncbi:cysteine desulfurase family protein [Microbacterium sp. Se5.02b]|uniref:cysteine desulfurase family protein n=1 Tax=Microbacterium sp. Se5.02b TaxID=2864103 RepID=UPI001C68C4BE|nr:aminotransferase class V-fold PLP-dependent enzyme [Microbacterium sp. Se5.02b]QYM65860.1 aminotransferase class V-fold PLP-dependent enzyme [Microbacterium sp. Se5.02b]